MRKQVPPKASPASQFVLLDQLMGLQEQSPLHKSVSMRENSTGSESRGIEQHMLSDTRKEKLTKKVFGYLCSPAHAANPPEV